MSRKILVDVQVAGSLGIGGVPSAPLHVYGDMLIESGTTRTFGINNLASGHTAYTQFGDSSNRIECTYGGTTVLRSYNGFDIATAGGNAGFIGTANGGWKINTGLTVGGTGTPTALVDVAAASTSAASLRLRAGTAPTVPNDGDIWNDGTSVVINSGLSVPKQGMFTLTGASASDSVIKAIVDTSTASQPAIWAKNNTNFAHGANMILAQMLNASDSGDVLRVDNSGTGKNISSRNGTTETFSVSKTGVIAALSGTLSTPTTSANSIATIDASQTFTNKTLTLPVIASISNSGTVTIPTGADTLMGRATADTITGVKTFGAAGNVGKLLIAGTTSGTTILNATAAASGTLTLPAATDTLVGKATVDTLTNKTLTSPTITAATMNATNIVTDTTTGLTIGTGTTQKIAFLGSTPVAQQTAASDLGTVMASFGLRVSGTTYTINTSGSGGFGSLSYTSAAQAYAAKTTAYTTLSTDGIIDCTSGTFTVTLRTSVGIAGRMITVKNSGAGTITVGTTSAQTIDGSATQTLAANGCLTMASDGANWKIIAKV